MALVDAEPPASSRLSTTVRVWVAGLPPEPKAPAARTICPFEYAEANVFAKLKVGCVRDDEVLVCALIAIVALAPPLTVTVPAPLTLSLPLER